MIVPSIFRERWPVLLLGLAAYVSTFLFLHLEQEWEIALLLGIAPLVLYIAKKSGMSAKCRQAVGVAPVFTKVVFLLSALALIVTLRHEHFALLLLATVLLYATISLGLTIQFGYAGLVNFAAIAFFGIGAYTMAVLNQSQNGLPDLMIIVIGGVVAALIGSLLILPVLRTKGHYAALITIAFGLLFRSFLEVNDILGGPQGLKVSGLNILGWDFAQSFPAILGGGSFYVSYTLLALVLLIGVFSMTRLIESSWLGLNMDSVRLDETASASFGINVARWKIMAFTVGNFFAGMSGALYASMSGFVAPASFNLSDSLLLVSIVLLGGMGNAVSVIPAAFLVVVLPEKFQVIQEYRLLLFAVIVILILRFKPSGLMPRPLRRLINTSSK